MKRTKNQTKTKLHKISSCQTNRYNNIYSAEIEQLEKIISGNEKCVENNFNAVKSMTLIPDRTTRVTYDKKPMVKCRINGINCELLIDSGADVNVIKKSYLEKKIGVVLDNQNRRVNKLKCANSSEIKVYGEIGLSVEIGPNSKEVNFLVVDNILPEIILGIRSLKY